jgi:hypothetical protein
VQKIILSTKGNCVLCCFVDLTYVDGSQPPARPECLLHTLKNVIASYILQISLNEARCVQSKAITTSPLARTSTGHIARYSRTPHIRTLVVRIAIHLNRLGRSCKHFVTVIVINFLGLKYFPHLSNKYKELSNKVLFVRK